MSDVTPRPPQDKADFGPDVEILGPLCSGLIEMTPLTVPPEWVGLHSEPADPKDTP